MNILICVTGGIAAYKMASVVSRLTDEGHKTQVVMTKHAMGLVQPMTFSALSHLPVIHDEDEWTPDGQIKHIEIPQNWADLMVIAPATANIMAKMVYGIADEVVSTMYLAYPETKPVLICPAMNTVMWGKSQTISNVARLENRKNHSILYPVEGKLACGTTGMGKLPSTKDIVSEIKALLPVKDQA